MSVNKAKSGAKEGALAWGGARERHWGRREENEDCVRASAQLPPAPLTRRNLAALALWPSAQGYLGPRPILPREGPAEEIALGCVWKNREDFHNQRRCWVCQTQGTECAEPQRWQVLWEYGKESSMAGMGGLQDKSELGLPPPGEVHLSD